MTPVFAAPSHDVLWAAAVLGSGLGFGAGVGYAHLIRIRFRWPRLRRRP